MAAGLVDACRLSEDIRRLSSLSSKLCSDIEAVSSLAVTKDQMRRQLSVMSGLVSCVGRVAAENRRLQDCIAGLRVQGQGLREEVRRLRSELERLRSERKRSSAGLFERISAVESRLDGFERDVSGVRSLAEGSSRDVVRLKLRAGKRRYLCD